MAVSTVVSFSLAWFTRSISCSTSALSRPMPRVDVSTCSATVESTSKEICAAALLYK